MKTFAGQTHAQQLQQAGIVVNQTNWPVCVRSLRVGLLIGRVRRIGVFRFNRQRGAFSGSSCDSAPLAAAPFYRRIRPLRACAVVRDFPCSCLREESWRSISVRFSSLREVSCSCDCRRAALAQRIDLAVAALLQMLIACFLIEQRDLQQLLLAPQLRQRTQ